MHKCETILILRNLNSYNNIKQHIYQGDYFCGLFIDFCKAIVTGDCKILIEKLNYYGICGISNK